MKPDHGHKQHVTKTRVPHPDNAKTLEEHLAFAEHMIAQIRGGKYVPVGEILITKTDHGDVANRTHEREFNFRFRIKDANPAEPAAPAPTPEAAVAAVAANPPASAQ